MKLANLPNEVRVGRLKLPLSLCIALLSTWPRAASAQDIGQMCYVQQYIQSASEGEFTDPQLAHPVSDAMTECQVNYAGTVAADFECTSSFHDAQKALAFATSKEFIFRHCFPGIQFQDGGKITDQNTGQQFHDLESNNFADYSWIEVRYETTPDAKGIYHVRYLVHSPPKTRSLSSK